MKKYILSALITINLLNASGIPVVDGVANAQSMAQNIKTIEEAQNLILSEYDVNNEIKKYYYSFRSKKIKTQTYYVNNKNKDSIIKK